MTLSRQILATFGFFALGAMAIVEEEANPDDIDFGTAYAGVGQPLEGTIEAETFNWGAEGYAYHNVDLGFKIDNDFRQWSDVEIQPIAPAEPGAEPGYMVSYIVPGEFLAYQVDIQQPGEYTATLNLSAMAPQKALDISLLLNSKMCADQTATIASFKRRVREYHTAGLQNFMPQVEMNVVIPEEGLVAGENTITVCFNDVDNTTLDSFSFERTTVEDTTFAPTPAPLPYECAQGEPPPGVKPGSCFQVYCFPDAIAFDEPFHATVTWCLDRPRRGGVSFDTLDLNNKFFISYGEGGSVYTDYEDNYVEPYQCGINTFTLTLPAELTRDNPNFSGDVMFKYFITPVALSADGQTRSHDPFPNMLAETGWNLDADQYGGLENDCEIIPLQLWNDPLSPPVDAIDIIIPECFNPGEDFNIMMDVELVLQEGGELTCNLMGGLGADEYLSDDEIFITQQYMEIEDSGRHIVTIPAWKTDPENNPNVYVENLYVACWLGPATVGTLNPNGVWQEGYNTEYHLRTDYCYRQGGGVAPAGAVDAPVAAAAPAPPRVGLRWGRGGGRRRMMEVECDEEGNCA